MNTRALQFHLLAAEAAAAAAAAADAAHAAEGDEPGIAPKALLLQIQAQGTADEPASRQGGSGLAPTMGTECLKLFASKGATRPTATATSPAAVAGGKKPTKKVPRKATDVLAINMAAAAPATTAVEKKLWEEGGLSAKWPATEKRGRTAVAPVQASSCSSEEEEAAMTLLELASYYSRTSSETQQQSVKVEPVRHPNAASGHQIQTSAVEVPMLLDHPAGLQAPEDAQELSAAESQTLAAEHVTALVNTTEAVLVVVAGIPPFFPNLDSGAGDKEAKKRRVTNPDQTAASTSPPPPPEGAARTPPTGKKHTCRTCGKLFYTHQALGGHVSSSHVKGKTTSARHDGQSAGNGNITIPASAGTFQERQDAQPSPAQAPTPKTLAKHECDVCHLTFPSGQALGGHMGKHRKPAAPVLEPESRDFDLNERRYHRICIGSRLLASLSLCCVS